MPSAVGGEEAMNGPTTTARRVATGEKKMHGVDHITQRNPMVRRGSSAFRQVTS